VSDKVEDDLVFTVGEPMLLGRPQTGVLHLRFRIMPESPSGHPQNGSHIRLAMTTETVALLLAGSGTFGASSIWKTFKLKRHSFPRQKIEIEFHDQLLSR
jgi:hypothetical protein